MTYTIIGGDKKEYGPISTDDLRQWIAEGRLNAQSLCKSEADTAWRTLGSFPEFADAFRAFTPPPISALPPASATGNATDPNWQADVESRAPELRLGECLGAGFSFIGSNFGFLIGAVLLTWAMNVFCAMLAIVIPILGPLASLCFLGVIMGGYYYACLRRMRGENVGPGGVFSGFQLAFGQLVLASLIATLLAEIGICFCIIPGLYLGIAWVMAIPLIIDKGMFFWAAMELSRKVVTKVWFEMFVLVLITFLPVLIVQIFSTVTMFNYFFDQYHAANNNMQQFAQNMQNNGADIAKMTYKSVALGQAAMLVNLFYIGGVMMRAYENLFGSRKS